MLIILVLILIVIVIICCWRASGYFIYFVAHILEEAVAAHAQHERLIGYEWRGLGVIFGKQQLVHWDACRGATTSANYLLLRYHRLEKIR